MITKNEIISHLKLVATDYEKVLNTEYEDSESFRKDIKRNNLGKGICYALIAYVPSDDIVEATVDELEKDIRTTDRNIYWFPILGITIPTIQVSEIEELKNECLWPRFNLITRALRRLDAELLIIKEQ